MTHFLGALALLVVIAMVPVRVLTLKRRGIGAMKFGATDKADFAIPPFALLYLYLVLASALGWPTVRAMLFASPVVAWAGVACCAAGAALMVAALVSFGRSFRVGIDTERPDALITTGAFAVTRNPIYVAFGALLLGEFLIQPSWILLLYTVAGYALFRRQVLREEIFLRQHYGDAYRRYAARVPRYVLF